MKNIITLAIATSLAILDVFNNYILKNVSLKIFSKPIAMSISMFLYLIQPWIVLQGLNFSTLTVLNLSWDLISDILVTILGLWYFREKIVGFKLLGMCFSLAAIFFFALDDYKS